MADAAAPRKILLCGDVGGSLHALYKRFETVRGSAAATVARASAVQHAHAGTRTRMHFRCALLPRSRALIRSVRRPLPAALSLLPPPRRRR